MKCENLKLIFASSCLKIHNENQNENFIISVYLNTSMGKADSDRETESTLVE